MNFTRIEKYSIILLILVYSSITTFFGDVSPPLSSQSYEYQNMFQLGEKFQKEGKFEDALKYYTSSLDYATKIGDYQNQCNSLIKIALINWNMSKLNRAEHLFKKAQSLAQRYNFHQQLVFIDKCLQIYSLYIKAKEYRDQNEYQESAKIFQTAIDLAESINSSELKVKCIRQQGITYLDEGNLSKFYQLQKQALQIAIQLNHKDEERRCANNIGYFYLKTDSYSDALIYFNQALSIAEQNENKSAMPDILNNIGIIYKLIGEYDKALDFLNRALSIDTEIGEAYYISLDLNDIGTTFRHKGLVSGNNDDFRQAIKYYEECLGLSAQIQDKNLQTEIEITVFNNMGSVHSDLIQYSIALDYFKKGYEKAKDFNDIRSMGMLANNIGIVQANMGNFQQSTKYFTDAIQYGNTISSGKILWEAYLELARSYVKQSRFDLAINNYIASIKQIETIRSQIDLEELKASFMGTDKRIEAFQELISLFISLNIQNPSMNYDKEAFNYLERGKARAFLDSLEISKIDISKNIDFKLQNTEAEIMKDISNLYTKLYTSTVSNEESKFIQNELQKKESELENLKREIRSKHPAYAELRYPHIISLEEAQKLINKETVFFEYSIGKEKSYAFVISTKALQIFELPSRKRLRVYVQDYLKALSDKDNSNFQIGYTLFQKLILPGISQNIKNIIFITDDILHYLPFETLITNPNENLWLIQKFNIAYSPSISSLNEIILRKKASRQKQNMDFLAFGDPDFGKNEEKNSENKKKFENTNNNGAKLFRLEYSGIEVEKISSLFSNNRTTTFLRENALEEAFKTQKLQDYKIIHFATHTEIDDKQPTRSRIVLTLDNDPKEDGLLQTREIYQLELNADLVTLSACSSGLGKFIRGEGIEGINRAFFYAGTSSVLMSLWTVNDQATYQLMERFYFHLRNSKSIMSSLREAKLEMIESDVLSHPYYWAGFIVSGKADHIIFPSKTNLLLYIGLFTVITSLFLFVFIKKKKK